jgi:hypothetical protein
MTTMRNTPMLIRLSILLLMMLTTNSINSSESQSIKLTIFALSAFIICLTYTLKGNTIRFPPKTAIILGILSAGSTLYVYDHFLDTC